MSTPSQFLFNIIILFACSSCLFASDILPNPCMRLSSMPATFITHLTVLNLFIVILASSACTFFQPSVIWSHLRQYMVVTPVFEHTSLQVRAQM